MEKMKVRDLMRPVQEFSRISSRVSLLEAVEALAEAQREFMDGKAPQRILLVEDEAGRIVGKLSPMDVFKGLEPNYGKIESLKGSSRIDMSSAMLESMKDQFRLWHKPLAELCQKAYGVKIENFVRLPGPDHMVGAGDTMDKAFHLFVVGRHDSLFVKDENRIVGIIRFSDVYHRIVQTMRECSIE